MCNIGKDKLLEILTFSCLNTDSLCNLEGFIQTALWSFNEWVHLWLQEWDWCGEANLVRWALKEATWLLSFDRWKPWSSGGRRTHVRNWECILFPETIRWDPVITTRMYVLPVSVNRQLGLTSLRYRQDPNSIMKAALGAPDRPYGSI